VWYGKSYYRQLIGNHTLAFDWCHFWWPWSTFEGHFSLGCHFHVHFSYPSHAFASHGLPAIAELLVWYFYQRVSIACYANRWYSQRRNVRPSVCPSVTLRYCIKTKKGSVMISSPSESPNILVSENIWFITKFEMGHPERWQFMRLGWVRTGDFGEFSTNKPPYLRNGYLAP